MSESNRGKLTESEARFRAKQYLLSPELLRSYEAPLPFDLEARENARKFRPGADFAVTSHNNHQIIVPPWHSAFRTTPEIFHGGEYGSGIFEGLSLVPVVKKGLVVGANIILLEPRMQRLRRSLNGRDLLDRVDVTEFQESLMDLASIEASLALVDNEGKPSRAYIRPSIHPGDGPLGVGIKPAHQIQKGVIIFSWPEYLDAEKAFGDGLTVVVSPDFQRLQRTRGKCSSNYGEAGVVGNQARSVGADEALYLAPYVRLDDGRIEYINAQAGEDAIRMLLQYGGIADGPGEEVFGLSGKIIIYPPLSETNRLGGTTLEHIIHYLGPSLGFTAEEASINMEDIREGRIDCLMFAGNAATVMPIGTVLVYPDTPSKGAKPVETIKLKPSESAKLLARGYREEVTGLHESANPQLLTPVDFEAGKVMEKVLREAYSQWF